MTKSSFYLLLGFLLLSIQISAQVSKRNKEAQANLERGHLKTAIELYQSVLAIEPDNRTANLNLGLIYSELLDNFVMAQPYLEKTIQLPARDTAYDVIFALGKCYQFNGDYDRAISFYNRLNGVRDLDEERNFQRDIEKLKLDCEYAQLHANDTIDKNIYFANAGKYINSDMPEYVPVLTSKSELIFTSKRQDNPKEELNYIDGKYYESMYIAKIEPNGFSNFRRYSLPDNLINSKMYNHHYAVVSLSQDQKKLFTFKDNKLYEINIDERNFADPVKLKLKKFDHYQNHAYLTKDGNTLFFTSDSEEGLGGTDIYQTTKNDKGEWGVPVNLGPPINTPFNEDAPFLDSDGTFYFASEGHPGFGNYDLFKSRFEDGKWTQPQNLGKPINTSAHDIFLVMDTTHSVGYFSSGRKGGFGDMDIYKIVYLDKFPRDCMPFDEKALLVTISDKDTSNYRCRIDLKIAPNYWPIETNWTVNGAAINTNDLPFDYDFKTPGTFPVNAKIMVGCDTCLNPVVACLNLEVTIDKNGQPQHLTPVTTGTNTPLTAAGSSTSPNENVAANTPLPARQNEAEILQSDKSESITSLIGADSKNAIDTARSTQTIAAQQASSTSQTPREPTVTPKKQRQFQIHFEPIGAEELAQLGIGNENILFDLSASTLLNTDIDILSSQLKVLQKFDNISIKLTGYADARGSAQFNRQLSLQRAKAVRQFLIANGLPANRIVETKGAGASNFVNECLPGIDCSEEKHKENRRVEINFVKLKSHDN